MPRSAVRCLVTAALLLVSSCGPTKSPAAVEADAAFSSYFESPSEGGYFRFCQSNAAAAAEHGAPYDAVGFEYQLRMVEIQAAESERAGDMTMSESVVNRIDEWRAKDIDSNFEESVPGAKKRLAAARERAERVR